jgi:hypothetical protein
LHAFAAQGDKQIPVRIGIVAERSQSGGPGRLDVGREVVEMVAAGRTPNCRMANSKMARSGLAKRAL